MCDFTQGKKTVIANNSVSTYISSHDGDGQPIIEYFQENLATKSFMIRSSVLGRKVLTRLDNAGNKSSTVFDVDGLLAVVQNAGPSGSSLRWTHIDPLGLSEAGDTKSVFDPMGNYIVWQHAPVGPPPNAYPPIAASFGGLGPSFGYAINSSCILDGIPTDCSLALNMLEHGSAAQCRNNDCGPIHYADPDTGNAAWLISNGSGFWISDGSDSDYLDPDDIQSGLAFDAYAMYFKGSQGKKRKRRAPKPMRVEQPLGGSVSGGASGISGIEVIDTGGHTPFELSRDRVLGLIEKMIDSDPCNQAFKDAGLMTPRERVQHGIKLSARLALRDPAYNSVLGITEAARAAFNKSNAPALTMKPRDTVTGIPIIFFSPDAFGDYDLEEAVPHEFIHGAGFGQQYGWGYKLGLWGHDLDNYPYYQNIIKNCK